MLSHKLLRIGVCSVCTMGKDIAFIGSLLDKRLPFRSVLDSQKV